MAMAAIDATQVRVGTAACPHEMRDGAMLADHYCALARYNTWMNERLYGVCATLGAPAP
jgi:hypothetical protein